MPDKAFQDHYSDRMSHCYGCGRLNEQGLHIQSFWDGDEGVCRFTPRPHHTAIPGFVYGGLIASLIDCHSTGTAMAASYRAEHRELGSQPEIRYLTASLKVDYQRPTPIDGELEIRARVIELKGKKAVVESRLLASGQQCAVGLVVAVRAPEHLLKG
jgi:acyl-coenzyme A thioesterase PaaI-like protein